MNIGQSSWFLVIGFAIMEIMGCNEANSLNAVNEFRVSYPGNTELQNLDPASVQVAGQYFILENIFGTLIDHSIQGELRSCLASKSWMAGK